MGQDDPYQLDESDPRLLGGLLGLEAEALWAADELAEVLRHQLAAPVPYGPRGGLAVQEGAEDGDGPASAATVLRFGDVLFGPDASLDLLEGVARFAKIRRGDPDSVVPPEVSAVLYFAAVAAAYLRRGRRLGGMPDAQVRGHIEQLLHEPWLDTRSAGLFQEYLQAKEAGGAGPSAGEGVADTGTGVGLDVGTWADDAWAGVGSVTPPRVRGYDIVRRIGAGGMGTVWRARQLGTGRDVALKVLSAPGFASHKARSRFEREVELTAQLDHDHVARVYESGLAQGAYFYAMELVEGEPLDRYVSRRGLGREQVLELMRTVCLAVQHAHQKGIIHRDLKPTNILVAEVDGKPVPKVLDFGLAKVLSVQGLAWGGRAATVSLDGDVAGTVAYMSPEQAAGRAAEVDTRSDVYSLGVILYQLLTGALPHEQSGSHLQVMRRIADEDVRRPRQAAPGLDPALDRDLEAVLLKALAKEPQHRYASAGELAADLGQYLAGEPVSARRVTLTYFAMKRARRHRVPLAIAAVMATALLSVAVWSYVRVSHERDIAKAAEARAQRQAELAQQLAQKAGQSAREALHGQAEAWLARGGALGAAGQWVQAKEGYERAFEQFKQLGESTERVEVAQAAAYVTAPPPLMHLVGHPKVVTITAVSPDRRTVATGDAGGWLRLWDAPTGRQIRTFHGTGALTTLAILGGAPTAHGGHVMGLTFSGDGSRLASCAKDNTARLWDVASGRELKRFHHPQRDVTAVALSPDGRRLVTDSFGDYTLRMWDVEAEKVLWEVKRTNFSPVLAFLPDGAAVMALGEVRDAVTGRLLCTLRGNVGGRAVSGDGRFIVCGGEHSVRFWNAADGTLAGSIETGQNDVSSIAMPGEHWFASVGGDGTAFVGKRTREGNIQAERSCSVGPVAGAAFTSDLNRCVTYGDGTVAEVCELCATREVASLPPMLNQTGVVAVSPDGRVALCVDNWSSQVKLMDAATGLCLLRFKGLPTAVSCAAFAPSGRRFLTGESDGTVRLWDFEGPHWATGPLLPVRQWHDLPEKAISVRFVDGGRLALAQSGNQVVCWDVATGKATKFTRTDNTLNPGLGLSPDGKHVRATTVHGQGWEWDLASGVGSQTRATLVRRVEEVGVTAFLPDGRAVSGCAFDLMAWDPSAGADGSPRPRYRGHSTWVGAVTATPDGRWIAAGADDGTVRLWSADDPRSAVWVGKLGSAVRTVVISDDGRRIVADADDGAGGGNVRCWDLSRPAAYRELLPRMEAARRALAARSDDPAALATLGEWYAFRGAWDWSADLFDRAAAGGAKLPHLEAFRAYCQTGRALEAHRELDAAKEGHEAPEFFLQLCANAIPPTPAAK